MKEKVNRKLIELDVELHLDLTELKELHYVLDLSPVAHPMRDKIAEILKANDPNF